VTWQAGASRILRPLYTALDDCKPIRQFAHKFIYSKEVSFWLDVVAGEGHSRTRSTTAGLCLKKIAPLLTTTMMMMMLMMLMMR
jgi:hypothetical protein